MSPDDPRHGTPAGYDAHRRVDQPACDPCLRAAATYETLRLWDAQQGQPRRVPAIGLQRRVRALVADGWTYGEIGAAFGVSDARARTIATHDAAYAARSTVVHTDAAYRRLCARTPPARDRWEKRRRSIARRLAARNGWLGSHWWDDDTIDDPAADPLDAPAVTYDPAVVERILGGDWRMQATTEERREVLRRWLASGRPGNELGRLTGWRWERYREAAA